MFGDVLEAIENLGGNAIPIELGKEYVWDEAGLNVRFLTDNGAPYRVTCPIGNYSFTVSDRAADFLEDYVDSPEFTWVTEAYKTIRAAYGNCRWLGACWTAKFKRDIIEFWPALEPDTSDHSYVFARVAKPASGIPTSASVIPADDFKDPVGDIQTLIVKLGQKL